MMKKIMDNFCKIVSVIALVLVVFAFFRITTLKQEINELNNKIDSMISQNASLRQSILSSVDSKMEEYDNIMVSVFYDYEDYRFDVDHLDTKVRIEALPKTYDPDSTRVYVVDGDGQEYPLEYKNSKYVGEITLQIFESLQIDHLVMDNDGVLMSQALNWLIAPEYEVLPEINISNLSDFDIRWKQKDQAQLAFNPAIHLDIFSNYDRDNLDLKSADLVVEHDGHEIDRVPFEVNSYEGIGSLELSGHEKRYDMNAEDVLYFYIDIQNGDFTIRRFLDRVSTDENDNLIFDENMEDYRYQKNIMVQYKDKVIYDIGDRPAD